MHTREVSDFFGLHEKMNCAFPLKVTIETFSKRRFSGFKKFLAKSVFVEFQLTQISLNLKLLVASCKGQEGKLCVPFVLF